MNALASDVARMSPSNVDIESVDVESVNVDTRNAHALDDHHSNGENTTVKVK